MSIQVWGLLLVLIALVLIALDLVMRYLARKDLRSLREIAATPRKATDPWEEPAVNGGVYDVVQNGDLEVKTIPDERVMEVRAHLYDLLLSPYTAMSPWAITKACIYLEHPKRPSGVQCVCGREKYGIAIPPRETA